MKDGDETLESLSPDQVGKGEITGISAIQDNTHEGNVTIGDDDILSNLKKSLPHKSQAPRISKETQDFIYKMMGRNMNLSKAPRVIVSKKDSKFKSKE